MIPPTKEGKRRVFCEILVRYMRPGPRSDRYGRDLLIGLHDNGYIAWWIDPDTGTEMLRTTRIGRKYMASAGCGFPRVRHFIRYELGNGDREERA